MTDYLDKHAQTHPAKLAVVFEDQKISWLELKSEVDAAAGYFYQKLGASTPEVVALLLTNSIEFITTYLGVIKAGHMAMPLDPAYKSLELQAIIDQVRPQLIVTQQRYQDQLTGVKLPIIMTNELQASGAQQVSYLRLPPKQQIASLTFTSGTTGKPKVVPNTHSNHIWNIEACSQVWDWTANDSLLVALPLSHMHGLVMGLSGALYHGNTLYLRQQAFDAAAILEELSSGHISFFSHVPLAYIKMLEHKGDYDLSNVRLLVSGGGPLPPPVSEQFHKRFGLNIIETYGTSETGRIAANLLNERLRGSPGRPLPGVEVKFSKDGELLVRSPGVFPGYYQNELASQTGFSDGYWRTGDLADLKDGHIYLKGRLHERIRKFGYTISPRDIEWALLKHPKIETAYVMGQQQSGQINDQLIYFIVGDINLDQLQEFAKQNLLFAWRPDKVIFLDKLPRTANGKPKLSQLRTLAGAAK